MNKVPVKIMVFPSKVDLSDIEDYDESVYGESFSDLREIRVNRVSGGYSILYKDSLFGAMDPLMFGNNIINLFNNSLPNTIIEVEIYYFYMDLFNTKCGKNIVCVDDFFNDCENPLIDYQVTPSVEYLVDHYDEEIEDFDFEQGYDDDEENDDDDEDDEEYFFDSYDDDEDDEDQFPFYGYGEDYDREDRKKSRKKSYNVSKIITSSSKARKNIKRHNYLISSNKQKRKEDKSTIRKFLKDFIPGDTKWAKAYRNEVLDRWMMMYVLTKKEAKILEKVHRERTRKSRGGKTFDRDIAVNMTKRLFERVNEPFYDPNR